MHAEAQSFAEIMESDKYIIVPFFQRKYVWEKKNWEDLLDNLRHEGNSHFLGSTIFKHSTNSHGKLIWSVIDGQQRLTTLSILFDACCKCLVKCNEQNQEYDHIRKQFLFHYEDGALALKFKHSRADRGAYEKVICGQTQYELFDQKQTPRIIECAEFFANELAMHPDDAKKFYDILTRHDYKILVNILLESGDKEQAIFDTINSAGVRLTAADTIKNLLFQRMIDLAGESGRSEIEQMHDEFWDAIFNREYQEYWYRIHSQGRINRSTLEMFLHNVAVVEGFYDPNKHSTSDLSECYKDFISKLALHELKEFVKKVAKYANCYRKFFWDEDVDHPYQYSFNDVHGKILNVLRELDTSTFDPLILKLVYENPPSADGIMADNLRQALERIVQYVLLHVVCGESTKNFNKECAMAISGDKPLDEYLQEKVAVGKISNGMVRLGLRSVKNRVARCILFWLELKWLAQHNVVVEKLVFNPKKLTLEHMMPQRWEEKWPVTQPSAVNPETGDNIAGLEAEQARAAAVYEIGNMTLLNNKLNSEISNDSIYDKIEGHNGNLGVAALAQMHYTLDVVNDIKDNDYLWNEKMIRDRTNELTEEFLATWGAGEAQHAESAEASHMASSSAASHEILSQSNDVAGISQTLAMPEPALPDTQLKIGKIAKTIFPVLFAENKITDEDIEFLTSDAGHLCFKTTGKVLKETSGDIDADAKDAHGKKRFYSNIVLSYSGKQYLLTREWFEKGKAPLMAWITNHGVSQDHVLALCMPKTATSKVLDKYDADMQSLMADLRAGKIKAKMSEGRFAMEEDRYDKVAAGKVDREWVLLTRGQLKRSVGIKTVRLYKFDGTLKPKVYMRWEVVSVGLEGEDSNGDSCECDVVNVPDGFKPESIVIHLGKKLDEV